jgi:UDP-glucose 4-epimerase
MNVLITGAFGYLGGRIAQACNEARHDLVLTSHRSMNVPDWINQTKGYVRTIMMDVTDADTLNFDNVDAVVHLASINNYESIANPQKSIRVNALGTLNAIAEAVKCKVKKFIYLSTCHVYGSPLQGILKEDMRCYPKTVYALSHALSEDMVLRENRRGSIDGIVLRCSNGFGVPASKYVNPKVPLVNSLCHQAMQNNEMVLTGGARETRNFISLHNISRAVVHCLDEKFDSQDGLFNLAGRDMMTIGDMAKKIAELCHEDYGFYPNIITPDEENSGSKDFFIDTKKIESTGFELKGSLNTEVRANLAIWAKEPNPFYNLP